MPITRPESLVIPQVPWSVIKARLRRQWTARDAPHHSVIGQTRSGKSYLTANGILGVCDYEPVLIIDGKGDDPTLSGVGRVVNNYPSKLLRSVNQLKRDDDPRGNWFRLVTSPERDRAISQVHTALQRVMREGRWIVVIDETRYVTDARDPGLAARSLWEALILRGGSRGVAMVSLTQEPRWVPGSFYTQSSFYWLGRIEDEAAHKRVAEIGSSRALMEHLPRIPRHHWVYTDNLDDQRFWALTKVSAR